MLFVPSKFVLIQIFQFNLRSSMDCAAVFLAISTAKHEKLFELLRNTQHNGSFLAEFEDQFNRRDSLLGPDSATLLGCAENPAHAGLTLETRLIINGNYEYL